MKRYFTVPEAEALLPSVETSLRELTTLKSSLDSVEASLRGTAQRIMFAGGLRLDRDRVAAELRQRERSAERLKELIEKVQEHGCLIKDLDVGLLDFPTLLNGEEVYLCWKLGEPSIGYWHAVDAGFRGRRPIDGDFLARHRGE